MSLPVRLLVGALFGLLLGLLSTAISFTWTVGWLLLLAMFLALEGAAIFNKDPDDTLSEHVWAWFSITGKSKGWRTRRFIFLAFWAWLTVHFFTGGWA